MSFFITKNERNRHILSNEIAIKVRTDYPQVSHWQRGEKQKTSVTPNMQRYNTLGVTVILVFKKISL